MSLIEYVDSQWSLVQMLQSDRAAGAYHASSASIELTDKFGEKYIEGTCLRAQYYRLTLDPLTMFKKRETRAMDYGNAIHDHETSRLAAARVLVSAEFPIYVPEHNISGRGDALIINPFSKTLPPEFVGVEIKTIGGTWGVITGSKGKPAEPKVSHSLQAAIYLDWGRKKHNIKTWKILYFSRVDGRNAEYNLTLTKEGEISIDGSLTGMFMDSIYERFRQLTRYINSNEVPPRDYEMIYDRNKLLKMLERQQLNKQDSLAVKSNKPIVKGDWNCRLCDYKDVCYPELEKQGEEYVETDW